MCVFLLGVRFEFKWLIPPDQVINLTLFSHACVHCNCLVTCSSQRAYLIDMSDDAERECPDDENLLYSKFSIQEFILGIRDGSMKQ